jgi:hypothetical protein
MPDFDGIEPEDMIKGDLNPTGGTDAFINIFTIPDQEDLILSLNRTCMVKKELLDQSLNSISGLNDITANIDYIVNLLNLRTDLDKNLFTSRDLFFIAESEYFSNPQTKVKWDDQ